MKSKDVLVSVVMGVYNGEKYIREAVQSVLDQTYGNFEFIIVNDASTDGTVAILEKFKDERIRILHNKENKRLAYSLNKGIKEAKGKYILRMDADDICMPDRFANQIAFMEKNPRVGVSFGRCMSFSERKILNLLDTNEASAEYIAANMIFFNTVYHPSVIIRSEIFKTMEYNEQYTVSEDVELWLRVTKEYEIVRTKDLTLLYRVHSNQVSTKYTTIQINQECKMKRPYLEEIVGDLLEDEDVVFYKIARRREVVSKEELFFWLNKLSIGNMENKIYNAAVFEQVLLRVGMVVAYYNRYLFAFLWKGIGAFGLAAMIKITLRMTKNIIEESIFRLKTLPKAKEVLQKYER